MPVAARVAIKATTVLDGHMAFAIIMIRSVWLCDLGALF
jgi:hypothetical protein